MKQSLPQGKLQVLQYYRYYDYYYLNYYFLLVLLLLLLLLIIITTTTTLLTNFWSEDWVCIISNKVRLKVFVTRPRRTGGTRVKFWKPDGCNVTVLPCSLTH